MDIKQFLQTVVTTDQPGYFVLAVSANGGRWLDAWYKWPQDIDEIVTAAERQAPDANVYFSSYLFKAPQATKENVLPSRTIQADLDDASLHSLPKPATVLVETSPKRHQGYWVLNEAVSLDEHESLSRKLTYSIELCDRSGWALGRKVRLPGTLNHKYLSGPHSVKILDFTGSTYSPDEFALLPEVPGSIIEHYDATFLEHPEGAASTEHPLELLERIQSVLPVKVYNYFKLTQPDRSEALWALLCGCFKAGLTRGEVFSVAKHSVNNKFADFRHRADQDLAKDVLRAEHTIKTNLQNDRQVIEDLYRSGLSVIDRKRTILNVVLKAMLDHGEFLRTEGDAAWYIRRDLGKPTAITLASEGLQVLLDLQFGLNSTEPESRYCVHGLRSHAQNLPPDAIQSALSYYDTQHKHILLHTGRKSVLRITADTIDACTDGAYKIIFPWTTAAQEFAPVYRPVNGKLIDWGEELFGNGTRGYGTSVENLLNLTPTQAMATLKVWFLFVLLRNAANTRPIIAAFGQPGSGKSFMFKKVYALLYGKRKSVSSVTEPEHFDTETSHEPLVILDNVDTWEKWLPDRLALSAGVSDITKRKLYSDADVVTVSRQAILGVTAHNPKFGREDVADRLLLLSYRRLERFESEQDILNDIRKHRNAIWGSIVTDLQRVLRTPLPQSQDVPQFRVEDFARLGTWIAQALGCAADFKSSIGDVKSAQQSFVLEEEGLLVGAIMKFIANKPERATQYFTASQLWGALEHTCDDPRSFANAYRNSVALSKKLSAMQSALSTQMHISQETNDKTGVRVWTLAEKTKTP